MVTVQENKLIIEIETLSPEETLKEYPKALVGMIQGMAELSDDKEGVLDNFKGHLFFTSDLLQELM